METKKTTKKYIETVGRRKTSTARVRITPGTKTTWTINDKNMEVYFPTIDLQKNVTDALTKSKTDQNFEISIRVSGGGVHSQSEAVRHGIARALVEFDTNLKDIIKQAGLLKRDPRAKERRKFGLKKARKAPQWSKR